MTVNNSRKPPTSFVTLMALMSAIVALSIDMMLPALGIIGDDLQATSDNDRQLVLTSLFLGLACAQIFYGPLSDRFGRKVPLTIGMLLFLFGCVISLVSSTMTGMLIGRFIQGVGAAGPRIICNAIVRDRYSGDAMASVVSLIMVVFILVPVIAPMLGQVVVMFWHWRVIFLVFIVLGVSILTWFLVAQVETLPPERRLRLSRERFTQTILEVVSTRVTVGYTLAAAFVFGAFLGFLNSAQQILQDQYGLGERFPFYFAILALSFGVASYLNSRLVLRYGMRNMTKWSIRSLSITAVAFLLVCLAFRSAPPLSVFIVFMMLMFSTIGLLFGNFSALALEPLGHIAGTASAVVGSATTMISLLLGATIGIYYNETVLPLAIGFAATSCCAYAAVYWTENPQSG